MRIFSQHFRNLCLYVLFRLLISPHNINNNDDIYSMNRKNLGVAVILHFNDFESNTSNTYKSRNSADKNVERLDKVLKNFGFYVRIYEVLTTNDVKILIKNLALENHEDSNSMMVVVMSHGSEE